MSNLPRWPLVIALTGLVLGGLIAADTQGPVRLVTTLWFLLVCTGMAFVPLLSIPSVGEELALGVVLSIALDTIVATTIVLVGGLSAHSALVVLEAICLVGVALQLWTWARPRAVAL